LYSYLGLDLVNLDTDKPSHTVSGIIYLVYTHLVSWRHIS